MPKCPACTLSSPHVYVGAINVECPNENCRHFNKKVALERDKAAISDLEFDIPNIYYPGLIIEDD